MLREHLPLSWAYDKTYDPQSTQNVLTVLFTFMLLLSLFGCAGGTGTAPPNPSSSSIAVAVTPLSAIVSSSGTQQFAATVSNSSNTAVNWSVSAGKISSSGMFTAPTVTQATTVNLTVTSVADSSKSASAVITVRPAAAGPVPLAVTTDSLATAITGVPYGATFSATGGTSPYTWTLSSGQLPGGITLSSGGILSGTTSQSGPYNFVVRVADSSSPANSATGSFTLVVDSSAVNSGEPLTFFGMHANHASTPWPSVPVGAMRLWDADNATWPFLNTAQGAYDWTVLDTRLAEAQQNSADVLYDLGRTPVWAQCGPSTSSPCTQTPGCAYSTSSWGGGPGQCYWPGDLNSDGTGSNQHWKDWVTAIATHSVNSTTAHIKYYEIWNEPNDTDYFRGTTAQLVRMTADAACIIKGVGPGCTNQAIDPNAMIVTPAATYAGALINTWLSGFFADGGAQYVDVIAFHGYDGTVPENIVGIVSTIDSGSIATYNQSSKPLFDTEFSWGLNNPITDPDQQSGFVSRSLLLHWSSNVQRLYWYSWDTSGTMWSATSTPGCATPDPSGNGFDCEISQAFAETQSWILDATLTAPCSSSGTVWTCTLTKANGYQALAVWDTSQTCSNGHCTTSNFQIPTGSGYVHYLDLAGQTSSMSGSTVAIGYKPILLQNQ